MSATFSSATESKMEDALMTMAQGLISAGFKFIDIQDNHATFQEAVSEFDKERTSLCNSIAKMAFGGQLPGFLGEISDKIVGIGVDAVDDEEIQLLYEHVQKTFPLAAFAFSKLYGPRIVPIISGQHLDRSLFFHQIDQFEVINQLLLALGSRGTLTLFGKSFVGIHGGGATGSLVVVTPTTQRAEEVQRWAAERPLQSDTAWNNLTQAASRWQFWTKLLIGMIEYKPYQLRQEIVVIDAESGTATSTASMRLPFEFGFGLGDLT